MKTINLPPYAPTLMESTRAIGYSLEAAIADVIDNSLAAGASKIDIEFYPIGDEYIAVLDNGNGMKPDELTNAMQYGSKSPNELRDLNDLGRYGLGLKTASLSQCRRLTVVSVCEGEVSGRRWDLDFVQQVGEWSLIILDAEDIESLPCFQKLKLLRNGTLVIWQNLDKLKVGSIDFEASLGTKMDRVRDMNQACPFCNPEGIILSNDLAVAIYDRYPVNEGHMLIIPRRHVEDYWASIPEERRALGDMVEECKKHLDKMFRPDGYNIGINCGEAAGQTVMHLHVHLIPRYIGDIDNPRGGVRGVVPSRRIY